MREAVTNGKAAYVLGALLVGCASTGVVQTDGDNFMIAKKSPQVGLGPPIAARAEVYQEANAFCSRDGRVVETVRLELTDSGLGRSAAAVLEFRCKSKS